MNVNDTTRLTPQENMLAAANIKLEEPCIPHTFDELVRER